MVTSHSQSRDGGEGRCGKEEEEGRLGCNHKDNSITPRHQLGCAPAISHPAQHFSSTRFNHLAAILLNAVHQGKGRNTWLWLWIAPLTACSGEQSLRHRPVTVSQLEWCTGHLAANSLAILSARKKGKYVKGVMTWWLCSSFTWYWLITTSWSVSHPCLVFLFQMCRYALYLHNSSESRRIHSH